MAMRYNGGLLKRYSMCAHIECFDPLSGSTRFFDDSLPLLLVAEHDSAGGVCMGQLLTMCVCLKSTQALPGTTPITMCTRDSTSSGHSSSRPEGVTAPTMELNCNTKQQTGTTQRQHITPLHTGQLRIAQH